MPICLKRHFAVAQVRLPVSISSEGDSAGDPHQQDWRVVLQRASRRRPVRAVRRSPGRWRRCCRQATLGRDETRAHPGLRLWREVWGVHLRNLMAILSPGRTRCSVPGCFTLAPEARGDQGARIDLGQRLADLGEVTLTGLPLVIRDRQKSLEAAPGLC